MDRFQRPQQLTQAYLRRILKPRQMDMEYTFWLMLQLCVHPKTAYRHVAYHKQTKNQWARDDPAFVVVCALFQIIASLAYCVTFGTSVFGSLYTIISAVFIDFITVGALMSTAYWFIANRFLRKKFTHSHAVEQVVEWGYAFDVHCNSFFPLFVLLYVVQFIASPLLLHTALPATLCSVVLYVAALGYYQYLTFLGYAALPFLENTQVVLWPLGLVLGAVPLLVLGNINPSRALLWWYFSGRH